jgi:hypothetical protein
MSSINRFETYSIPIDPNLIAKNASNESLNERSMSKLLDKVVIPKYMFKGSGSFRRNWDMGIIVLAIYNSVTIPLTIAFNP